MAEGFMLDVHEYCSYCGDFIPELRQSDISTYRYRTRRVLNTISCENASKCARLIESLENKEQLNEQ